MWKRFPCDTYFCTGVLQCAVTMRLMLKDFKITNVFRITFMKEAWRNVSIKIYLGYLVLSIQFCQNSMTAISVNSMESTQLHCNFCCF
jgi:hypothetical protein